MKTVKNLAQLKRELQNGARFVVLKHYNFPQYEGQVRIVNIAQTNGIYTHIEGVSPEQQSNSGRGLWYGFTKASDYVFDGDTVKISCSSMRNGEKVVRPIMDIALI